MTGIANTMPLWTASAKDIVSRLDVSQYRFLTAQAPEPYLTILIELYQARQSEFLLELPFDLLYERTAPVLESLPPERIIEPVHLRKYLDQLAEWGNVALRLEPKRIRRIQDRGLERYLVRLTDETVTILQQLESRFEGLKCPPASAARWSLSDLEESLVELATALQCDQPNDEVFRRAGRQIHKARQAVERASHELLQLDVRLSETSRRPPDRGVLSELIVQLDSYFVNYLVDLDARRRRCHELMEQVKAINQRGFLREIDLIARRDLEEDPSLSVQTTPRAAETVRFVSEFLEPNGRLDDRRHSIHQRVAEVVGHLKRALADLVRRSQLSERLRAVSTQMIHAEDEPGTIDRFEEMLTDLWRPAQAVLDANEGTPVSQCTVPRPYRYRPTPRLRFAGATIHPSENGRPRDLRMAVAERFEELNGFVDTSILQGRVEADLTDAQLDDFGDVKRLLSAIRSGCGERSAPAARQLTFRVEPATGALVKLTPADGSGSLTLPSFTFHSTHTH